MVANNNSSDSSDRTRSLKEKAYVRMFLKDRKYGNGHVKISGVLLPSFFRISKTDNRTQRANAISLHHPNVLRCYCIRKKKHRSIYAYEAFRCTLEDVCGETNRFWQLDGDNRIVCMSKFFCKLCLVLIKIVFSLNEKDRSHQRIGVLRNIILCENDVPKVRNISSSAKGGIDGLTKDLSGIASIIDQIITKTTSGYHAIPVEVICFKNLLQNYISQMDISDLKSHPVFFTPEKRKCFMYQVVEHMKQRRQNWKNDHVRLQNSTSLLNRTHSLRLDKWMEKAGNECCLRKGLNMRASNGTNVYHDSSSCLVLFVRNTFAHINHKLGVQQFMSLWNINETFRNDYKRSMLRSLNRCKLTQDGRIRTPCEKQLVEVVEFDDLNDKENV